MHVKRRWVHARDRVSLHVMTKCWCLHALECHHSAVVTTLAGDITAAAAGTLTTTAAWADGIGTNAQFSAPSSIAIDQQLTLYVADMNNRRIRTIGAGGLGMFSV